MPLNNKQTNKAKTPTALIETASSKIWTQVAVFISPDNNHYAKHNL